MKAKFHDLHIATVSSSNENCPRSSEGSVLELKDGGLLIAFCYYHNTIYGSGDAAPSRIAITTSYDGCKTFAEFRVIAEMDDSCVNIMEPSLLYQPDGSIACYYCRFAKHDDHGVLINLCKKVSFDEGNTWSEDEILYKEKPYYPINDAVKRLSDGSLIFAMAFEDGGEKAFTIKTDDDFNNPIKSNVLSAPMRGVMEPCVAERSDGVLNMVLRTQLGSVFVSESYDKGLTWTKPQVSGLRAPESCPCLTSIPGTNGQIVVWNNSEYDMTWASHYGKRTPLTAAISCDGLKTFSEFFDIETNPRWAFSNPAVTVTKDGLFILSYWATEYDQNNTMGGPMDFKIATFRVDIEE